MNISKSLHFYIAHPEKRKAKWLSIFGKYLSDKKYLKKIYKIQIGRPLNLSNPKTYTEKIQWLKLYDRNPKYTLMQDKYTAREYVRDTIGEEYLVPLLGVWDDANEIDFDKLPNQFVLKCNHDCASVVICRDKETLDIEKTKRKLNACLKRNYYESGREWAYKDIKPCIIAEKLLSEKDGQSITDYKFFCFSGKARMLYVATGQPHSDKQRIDFYDIEFNHLPVRRDGIPCSEKGISKPEGFEQLVYLAEKMAEGIPFIRVDFYLVDKHPYFGEVAFYPSSGLSEFIPYEWEEKVGSWIQLPEIRTNK